MSEHIEQSTPGRHQPTNRSITRAINILRALAGSVDPLTATDIAKKIDLPRPTTFRLLSTLEEEGFVERTDTLYSIGWDLARIARTIDPATKLISRTKDLVDEIASEIGETVTLSLRQGQYELDLILQASPQNIRFGVMEMTGLKWPLHASSTGKLLLAEFSPDTVRHLTGDRLEKLTDYTITDHQQLRTELERVQREGWAYTVNELEDGIFSSAVPIRDSTGALIAALALMAPSHRIDTEEARTEKTKKLAEGAARVQRALAATASQPG